MHQNRTYMKQGYNENMNKKGWDTLGIYIAQIKINSRRFAKSAIARKPDNANILSEPFSVNILTIVICMKKIV